MKKLENTTSIELKTTAKKLWDILTLPKWTEQYMFNCKVISTFDVGATIEWKGTFQGVDAHLTGEILAIEPRKLLKYSNIDPALADPAIPENFVHITYNIEPNNDGLIFSVTSETFDGNEARFKEVINGWEGLVFPAIINCVEAMK